MPLVIYMAKKGKYKHLSVVMKLSELLKEYRKSNKLTREKLALEINISSRHLADIENCNTKCSIDVLSKIKSFTNIDTDYILMEENSAD